MDPAWLFILTLAALHVIEGFLWVRRDALAFAGGWRGFSRQQPGGPLGTQREVLFPLSPFPPLREAFIVEPWPLTMTPDAVWLVPVQTFGEPLAPPPEAPSWTWEEAARTQADGRLIEGPGGRSVKASSAALAKFLVARLHELAVLNDKKRAKRLDQILIESHDLDAIEKRIEAYRNTTWRLRWYGNLVLPALLLSAYGVFFVQGVIEYWPYLVGSLAFMLLLTWIETWWAHRKLFADLRGDRWTIMVLMLASPPAAARAQAWLARDVLARFHPLAVAAVLAPREDLQRLAEDAWRDLSYPLGPEDPAAVDDLTAVRSDLKDALRRLARVKELDVDAFERTPDPEPSVEAYCPRCLEVYRTVDGECSDCPGVAKRPLAAAEVSQPA